MTTFAGVNIVQNGVFAKTGIRNVPTIQGVGTGIPAFVGMAEKGKVLTPNLFDSYEGVVAYHGVDSPLTKFALAAFLGGAGQVMLVRTDNGTAKASLLSILIGVTPSVYSYEARDVGTEGNRIATSMADISPVTKELKVRYVDSQNNQFIESFALPRYVPKPEMDVLGVPTPMFFSANNVTPNTKYYYLYNTVTKNFREIPRAFWLTAATKTDFKNSVFDKKEDQEILVELPYGTGTNKFPPAIIQTVVNFGGLSYAKSEYIVIKDIDPDIDSLLTPVVGDPVLFGGGYNPASGDDFISHTTYLQLEGGANGEDGTGYYTTSGDVLTGAPLTAALNNSFNPALSVLATEDVNFVLPAYLFKYKKAGLVESTSYTWSYRYNYFAGVVGIFKAHVTGASSVTNRKYRTSIYGVPAYKVVDGDKENASLDDYLNDTANVIGLIGDDRSQALRGSGFYSSVFEGTEKLYGGELLAAYTAGAHAAREVQNSIMWTDIGGIITGGLEFLFGDKINDFIESRQLFVERYKINGSNVFSYRYHSNPTAYVGSANRGISDFIARRQADFMNLFLIRNLETQFIGTQSFGQATAADIQLAVEQYLSSLVRQGNIAAYRNVTVTRINQSVKKFLVEWEWQPVSEVEQIFLSNQIDYTIQ